MDRALILCICMLAVIGIAAGTPMTAHAYSVYSDGLPSATYMDLFADVLNNCSSNTDYVFFRGGQYEYYGKLTRYRIRRLVNLSIYLGLFLTPGYWS